MTTNTIQLIIVKDEDLSHVSRISNESDSVNYLSINASATLTPNEIIQQILGLSLEKSVRVSLPGSLDATKKCTQITSYQLTCPSLQGQLQPDIPIGNQGIVDNTVLVLDQHWQFKFDRPEDDPSYHFPDPRMVAIKGAQHFNQIVQARIDKLDARQGISYDDTLFLAVVLYTDEDTELAKYVRLNFSSLDNMSGLECDVFVIERPSEIQLAETVDYWKDLLTFKTYALWGGKGWTRTKPYDKASAYGIARQLGISPQHLPCIVFFEEITSEDKIVIPIQGEPSNFFRSLFGALQEAYPASYAERDGWRASQGKQQLKEIKERIIQLSKKVESDGKIITYNFSGHTVFINQPSGPVQLSHVQNTSDTSKTTSYFVNQPSGPAQLGHNQNMSESPPTPDKKEKPKSWLRKLFG